MKKFNFFKQKCGMPCLLVTMLLLPAVKSQAQYVWEELAQLPVYNFLMSAEEVNGLIYLMGGIELNSTGAGSTTVVLSFNPADGSIQTLKPLPMPLAAMASAAYGGNIYVFGGIPWSQGPPSKKCYKYVPSLDEWFELPDLPTIPRGYAVAEVLGNKIYVIGGIAFHSTTTYNLVEVFDPEIDNWAAEPVAQMPTSRGYMGSAVLNNRIYVFGGGTPAPVYGGLSTVEYFDGVSWTVADPMPTQRYGAGAGVLGNTVYVSGGVLIGWEDVNVTEGYSEETGWQTFEPLPVNMHAHAVVSFGDVLYAFGGVAGPDIYNTVLVYHPLPNSTDNPLEDKVFDVFPNPASDRLTIVNHSASDGCLTLVQTDGRVVAKMRVNGFEKKEISVANVPQGLVPWRWSPGCEGPVQAGWVLVVRR